MAEGAEIEVDGAAGTIRILDGKGEILSIQPIPPFMQELLRDGGLMRHLAKKRSAGEGRA